MTIRFGYGEASLDLAQKVQFKVKSAYNKLEVNYENQTILLAQKTFDSKIDVDGVTFILGFSYLF